MKVVQDYVLLAISQIGRDDYLVSNGYPTSTLSLSALLMDATTLNVERADNGAGQEMRRLLVRNCSE